MEGKERNADEEWNIYLESTTITSLWGDSEDRSVKRPTTPEHPKTPEVKPVTPPLVGSGIKSMTPGSSIVPSFTTSKTVMAGGEMKLPVFHGNGLEDPQQHWFLSEIVWRVKQVIDANMKVAQLATTFRDRALSWYMKFSGGQNKTLDEIQIALIIEFKKPKLESQCITELKKIKHLNGESTWDFDQRFKVLMGQVSFPIP